MKIVAMEDEEEEEMSTDSPLSVEPRLTFPVDPLPTVESNNIPTVTKEKDTSETSVDASEDEETKVEFPPDSLQNVDLIPDLSVDVVAEEAVEMNDQDQEKVSDVVEISLVPDTVDTNDVVEISVESRENPDVLIEFPTDTLATVDLNTIDTGYAAAEADIDYDGNDIEDEEVDTAAVYKPTIIQTIDEEVDTIQEVVEEEVDTAADVAVEVVDTIQEVVEEEVDSAADVAVEVVDTIQEVADVAVVDTSSAVDKVVEIVEDLDTGAAVAVAVVDNNSVAEEVVDTYFPEEEAQEEDVPLRNWVYYNSRPRGVSYPGYMGSMSPHPHPHHPFSPSFPWARGWVARPSNYRTSVLSPASEEPQPETKHHYRYSHPYGYVYYSFKKPKSP